jgi:YVTN family beta-propeller protein
MLVSGAGKPGRHEPQRPAFPRRLGRLLSVVCLLGWIPLWSQQVYVANTDDNTVSVIQSSSDTVIATVPLSNYGYGVAITPNGQFVYVTDL